MKTAAVEDELEPCAFARTRDGERRAVHADDLEAMLGEIDRGGAGAAADRHGASGEIAPASINSANIGSGVRYGSGSPDA